MKSNLLFSFAFLRLWLGATSENATDGEVTANVRLTVGSMLNVTCRVDDDCLLKNSLCSPLTGRCECNLQTMESNSRCKSTTDTRNFFKTTTKTLAGRVIYCLSSAECLRLYPNTVCSLGRCQCRFGLKANGQCLAGSPWTEGLPNGLPSWSYPLILLSSTLLGAFASRSPLVMKIVTSLLTVLLFVFGQLKKTAAVSEPLPSEVISSVVSELIERNSHPTGSHVSRPEVRPENCRHVHQVRLKDCPETTFGADDDAHSIRMSSQ